MRSRTCFIPGLSFPGSQIVRRSLCESFPPDIVISRERGIGENRIFFDHLRSNGIGFFRSSGSNAKESIFGIDAIELAVFKMEPGNIIPDAKDRPIWKNRLEHRKIG